MHQEIKKKKHVIVDKLLIVSEVIPGCERKMVSSHSTNKLNKWRLIGRRCSTSIQLQQKPGID